MELKYNEAWALKIERKRNELYALEKAFSEDALQQTGLEIDDILENERGARYRVGNATVYTRSGRTPGCVVLGHRTYRTGHPDARSITALDLGNLKKVEGI